jgi:membrane protease YdiL (CAAX protease family)
MPPSFQGRIRGIMLREIRFRSDKVEERIRQSKGLRILDIILVFAITFFANILCSFIVDFAYSVSYIARNGTGNDYRAMVEAMYQDPSILMFSALYNLIAIGVVVIFWRFVDRQELKRLGYRLTGKSLLQMLLGCAAAFAAIGLIVFLGAQSGIIQYQGAGSEYFTNTQLMKASLVSIVTFLLVGFGEETVFRSYIQNHLTDIAGNRYGLVLAALVFTAAHLFTYGKLLDFIDVFLAGVILGYAFMLTKSIYFSAFFHFVWDYLQMAVFRIQDYQYYKGPVLYIYNNIGDLVIKGFNLGNQLELIFIFIELILLSLMFTHRKRLQKLCAKE